MQDTRDRRQKGSTTIFICHIREPPNITEPRCRTNRRQYKNFPALVYEESILEVFHGRNRRKNNLLYAIDSDLSTFFRAFSSKIWDTAVDFFQNTHARRTSFSVFWTQRKTHSAPLCWCQPSSTRLQPENECTIFILDFGRPNYFSRKCH